MEIIGKVVLIQPLVTGQGRNGEWRKQEFVIEIPEGQFPKKVCFSLWGDKIDQAALAVGDQIKVSFDLESREYNNRWYTEAKAWRVEKQVAGASAPVASAPNITQSPLIEDIPASDDLPF